jgi:hypothetical protein
MMDNSVDAPQRRRIAAILVAMVVVLVAVGIDLATGGRPDPPALRAAATVLDGAWRFRTGDDPHWADVAADDRDWETIDLTAPPGSHDGDVGLPDYVAGWMARGHPGYHGFAWYRRAVTVPATAPSWDILGPTLVDHGYELYWNGRLLGGSGRIGADPRLVATRPTRFALPDSAAGTQGVLAIRVFMLPPGGPSADGGGLHTAPMLAPRPVAEGLHRAQWARTVAGYIADAVEPIVMFALIALALTVGSRTTYHSFLMWTCVALAFMAERRLNNAIVAWTDLQQLTTYSWLASWLWVPAVAAWAVAWNRWPARPWRSVDVSAMVLAIGALVAIALHSARATRDVRLAFIALFVMIAMRVVRGGTMRVLALATLAAVVAGLFGGELLDPLGVPGIWFPFGIGVSRTQYIYAIVIPLLAVLIVRASSSPSRETSAEPSRGTKFSLTI